MLKLIFISACIFLFTFDSYAQFKFKPVVRVGIARRPELFELKNYLNRGERDKGYTSDIGLMNNPNLVLEFSQRLKNDRWIIQLSNYFSDNYLATLYDTRNTIRRDISSFKYDIFVDGLYEIRFRKSKKSFIYVGAGFGRMNISKKFDYNYPTGDRDSTGDWIYEKRATALSFWAPRVSAGFAYGNLNAFVIAHSTPDMDFNRKLSLWVEYKLLYSFKFKKKELGSAVAQFKNAPQINVGIAYRPVAIELSGLSAYSSPPRGYLFKGYTHKNNPNLVLELNQKLNRKKWSIQFSNYLSYGYQATITDSLNKPINDITSLKYDFLIDALYELGLNKSNESNFYIGAGIGYMNIGKKFTYQVPTGNLDNNGKEIYRKGNSNLSFLAPRISFGYARKNISAWLVAHGTPDNNLESNPTIWTEIKLLRSFQLKKKKI